MSNTLGISPASNKTTEEESISEMTGQPSWSIQEQRSGVALTSNLNVENSGGRKQAGYILQALRWARCNKKKNKDPTKKKRLGVTKRDLSSSTAT